MVRQPTDRFAQLATVDLDGQPRCRTVVIRGYDADRLLFCADSGSAKVDQLARDPRAELCWYLPGDWRQLRFTGPVTLARASRAELWASLSADTRAQFDSTADEPPERFVVYALHPNRVDDLDLTSRPFPHHEHVRDGERWISRSR